MATEFQLRQKDPLLEEWELMYEGDATGWVVTETLRKDFGSDLEVVYRAFAYDLYSRTERVQIEPTRDEAAAWLIAEYRRTDMVQNPKYIWRRLMTEVSTVAIHMARSAQGSYGTW